MEFLKVPKKEAEKVRRELIRENLLSKEYDVVSEGGFVFFPIAGKWKGFEVTELDVEKRPKPHRKLEDALKGILTGKEAESLVKSFDIIGDIAVIEIPPGLEDKEKSIGEALLRVHKNLRTVLKKLGGMEGEYRVRRFARIAGEDRTETVYTENGVRMRLDVAKVYFSVRLSSERKRIAGLVKGNERVLVLFAGVGPFALAIARKNPHAGITAVEINPEAVRYMRENTVLNRFKNIEVLEGDARDFHHSGFDRIVMPLPKSAHEFLDVAFAAVKDGGVVHFYTIVSNKEPLEEAWAKAKKEAAKGGAGLELLSGHIVRPYSPSMVQVVLDLRVRKKE
jgi:tRNA (guanine37-N1)-methyltransferase